LFINTSSSEGIPVSMMEAQSFGIPILAMDVGGVREIVGPQTGRLLQQDDPPLPGWKGVCDLPAFAREASVARAGRFFRMARHVTRRFTKKQARPRWSPYPFRQIRTVTSSN